MRERTGWFERLLLALRVPRFDILKRIETKDELYLRRFYLVRRSRLFHFLSGNKYEGLYLHLILRPDEDQHLHDHPWDFSAFILSGGYREEAPSREHSALWQHGDDLTMRVWGTWSYRSSRAEQLHRISSEGFKRTWTLFLVGPKRRMWGFKTESGWMPYEAYLAKYGSRQSVLESQKKA